MAAVCLRVCGERLGPATLYQDPTLRNPRQQSKINRHPHSAPALALFGHRQAPACARASAHQRRSSRLHTLSHRPDATLCPLHSARHLPRGTASPRFIVNRRRTLPKRVPGRFASEKHRRLRRSTPFASCRKLTVSRISRACKSANLASTGATQIILAVGAYHSNSPLEAAQTPSCSCSADQRKLPIRPDVQGRGMGRQLIDAVKDRHGLIPSPRVSRLTLSAKATCPSMKKSASLKAPKPT